MSIQVNGNTTVRELVGRYPQTRKTFEKYGIDYSLPDDACPTFRALYEELERMEEDLHQHIHLENNILFPRAIAAETDHLLDVSR
jgi:iron-sulfur cluster repair protein YtfE (RIC family)